MKRFLTANFVYVLMFLFLPALFFTVKFLFESTEDEEPVQTNELSAAPSYTPSAPAHVKTEADEVKTDDNAAAPNEQNKQIAAPTSAKQKSALELLDSDYQYNQENVDAFCREKWEKRGELDQSMYNYCKRTEKKNYADLKALVKKHAALEWVGGSLTLVWNHWTKRGITQYSMVKHGLGLEVDAFLDLEYESKQPSFNQQKMTRCVNQAKEHLANALENNLPGHLTGRIWSMIEFCYKNT